MKEKIKKVVLAYSGGLDTSVILKWLIETYGCEVVAFAADVGQAEELDGLKEKGVKSGASKVYIEDLREEFVRDFIFPMLRANADLRGGIHDGHLHRPPPDRQAAGDDRPERRSGRCLPRGHGEGERPGPV